MAGSNRATVTESEPSTSEIVASSSQPGSSFTGETGTKKKCLRGGYTSPAFFQMLWHLCTLTNA